MPQSPKIGSRGIMFYGRQSGCPSVWQRQKKHSFRSPHSTTVLNKKLSYRKESVHLTLLYHGLVVCERTVSTNSDN